MKVRVSTTSFDVEIPNVTSIHVSDNDLLVVYSANGSNVFNVNHMTDLQFVIEEPVKTLSLLQVTRYIMKAEGLSVSGAKAKAMEMML